MIEFILKNDVKKYTNIRLYKTSQSSPKAGNTFEFTLEMVQET